MIVRVCIGSSCHLRGSREIVELFKKEIAARALEDDLVLAGSFCLGQCNRTGVTVQVDDDIYSGVTRESFPTFFAEHVLAPLEAER